MDAREGFYGENVGGGRRRSAWRSMRSGGILVAKAQKWFTKKRRGREERYCGSKEVGGLISNLMALWGLS